MLTQERLKELLHYNPDTGLFTRLVSTSSKTKVGEIAGSENGKGYTRIVIDKKSYLSHRLAFLYMTESFPENHTDHINHIRDDNRWVNLRSVTHKENHKNKKISPLNTSGITGVAWHKRSIKWRARIDANGKIKHLGYFTDFFQAVCVRKSAEIKYGYHDNHGR